MKYRPSLGLALISKNEQENLPRLIESCKNVFDQICLTDTGSTDDTVSVAKQLGLETYHFDWVNDFSAARNKSFEPLKTDYIAWLDCDDILEDCQNMLIWRDDIMHLADYWLANYIYASRPDGTPACTFVRERVIKRSMGMKWKYFVHEGLVPPQGTRSQFIPSWRVRHMRTEEDLKKDRSRNLGLFEKNQDKLDGRMTYYWGKELFENQKPLDAVRKLEDAVSKHDLETHDRILSMQYLCYAYMQLNQFEKSASMALTALLLAPQRAEFYTIIGDAFLKMNRMMDAIPYFEAACHCQFPQGQMALSPVFFTEEAYGLYPKNQLARIYVNLGHLEKARNLAMECFAQYQNPETKQILEELNRIHKMTIVDMSKAKPCSDIVITCPPQAPYLWDGEIYRQQGMGGSETACIEMAEKMAELSGRSVKIFNARPDKKTYNGVEYLPAAQAQEYMSKNRPFFHLSWRHNVKLTDAPTFAWCHDLVTPQLEETKNYLKAIALTPFHADFMHSMQTVPYEKIWVSRNGIRAELFDFKVPKDENKIVFPSSPDRGLDRAILVLDEVRKEYPNLELHVFYGIEHLPQWGHQALYQKLLAMFAKYPWVKYHGKTEQKALIRHLKESVLWLHPCDFIETSCITAMEMIASGVYPVTRRLGGLKDTLKKPESLGMATLLNHDCVTKEEYQGYIDATLDALKNKKWKHPGFDDFKPKELSWKKIAAEWLIELPELAGIKEKAILKTA